MTTIICAKAITCLEKYKEKHNESTTVEPPPARQIGPFLPTPSPIITTTTSNRRNLFRNRFKNCNQSRRPPNAIPRRKPSNFRYILITRVTNIK